MGSLDIIKPLPTVLSSAIKEISATLREKFLGTQGHWVRSNKATSVLCSPSPWLKHFLRQKNEFSIPRTTNLLPLDVFGPNWLDSQKAKRWVTHPVSFSFWAFGFISAICSTSPWREKSFLRQTNNESELEKHLKHSEYRTQVNLKLALVSSVGLLRSGERLFFCSIRAY